jgi:hypothetical protein
LGSPLRLGVTSPSRRCEIPAIRRLRDRNGAIRSCALPKRLHPRYAQLPTTAATADLASRQRPAFSSKRHRNAQERRAVKGRREGWSILGCLGASRPPRKAERLPRPPGESPWPGESSVIEARLPCRWIPPGTCAIRTRKVPANPARSTPSTTRVTPKWRGVPNSVWTPWWCPELEVSTSVRAFGSRSDLIGASILQSADPHRDVVDRFCPKPTSGGLSRYGQQAKGAGSVERVDHARLRGQRGWS